MKRWISILLLVSVLFSLTGLPVSAEGQPAQAAEDPLSALRQVVADEQEKQEIKTNLPAEDEIVTLIVELQGKTGAELSNGRELSEVAQDEKTMDSLSRTQQRYIDRILEISPQAEIVHRYGLLFNGFSVKTRYGDKKEIEKLDGVESVVLSNTYTKALASAEQMTQIDQVWEEYQYDGRNMVVAVLDSGIDHTHKDMVISEGVPVKLGEEEVNEWIAAQPSPHGKYFTEKVPYGYNYADDNNIIRDELTEDVGYCHGMHVAGIIGANCQSQAEVESNQGVRGIAPECQLLALKIFSNDPDVGGAYEEDIIAALEDAVAMDADVINMSLGMSAGFHREEDGQQKAIQTAKEHGIIVVTAGGNTAYSTYPQDDEQMHPENYDKVIDNGTVAAPGISKDSIQVASLDNNLQVAYRLTAWKGATPENMAYVLSDKDPRVLPSKYPVEYCELGRIEDFAEKDLHGKIALIKRGEIEFKDKKLNAQAKGAVAVIIYNSDGDDTYLNNISTDENVIIPTVFMNNTDGEKLRAYCNTGTLTVSFEGEPMQIEQSTKGEMSYFSSWGPGSDLTFKPDVTAVGGQVWSTINDNGYQSMSGTSMACPNVAGIMVLLKQHMDTLGLTFDSPADEVQFAKTMLMNTCKVQTNEDGTAYSPRQQGAGLVAAKEALDNKVFVTWEGNPSIELKTINETRTLSLEFHNIGEKAVTFYPEALGKDGANIHFSEKFVTVPAGGKATLEAQLFINAGRTENDYVEGFLRFVPNHQNEGEYTIGLPFLGFYGDWANMQVIDDPLYEESSVYLATGLYTTINNGYLTQVIPLGGTETNPEYYAINPEDMNSHSNVMPEISLLRNAKELTIDVSDENGEILRTIDQRTDVRKEVPMEQQINAKVNFSWVWYGDIYDKESGSRKAVDEGQYYINVRATADYEGAEEQVLTMPIKVDKTAPTAESGTFFAKSNTCLIEIEAEDIGKVSSGIENFVFLVDGKRYTDASGKSLFQLGQHEDGKYRMTLNIPEIEDALVHTIDIGVTDHANNMQAARAYVIYAPQSNLLVQTDKQKYAIGENIQVDYQWLVTDAGADHYNIYIDSLDDLAGSTKETAFTIKKPLEEGVYSVIVQAVNSENQILDTNYTRIGVERETAGTETLKIENLTEATSLKNGQNVTAKIKVANTDTIAKDVTMMFCLYDEQSRMVDCVAVEKNIGSQQVGYLTGTLMLPQEGMYKAKIMVWDDPESMRSLMPYQEITMDKSK